ncbi:MAG: hypothetical protein Kow0069_36610 [Promethearchaeota archaeon]
MVSTLANSTRRAKKKPPIPVAALAATMLVLTICSSFLLNEIALRDLLDPAGPAVDPPLQSYLPLSQFEFWGEDVVEETYSTYNLSKAPAGMYEDHQPVEIYTEGDEIWFTNLTFYGLSADNATDDVELMNDGFLSSQATSNWTYFMEFHVPVTCHLNSISLYVQCLEMDPFQYRLWNVSVYNASWSYQFEKWAPDEPVAGLSVLGDPYAEGETPYSSHWEQFNFTRNQPMLDVGNTAVDGGKGVFFLSVALPQRPLHLLYTASDDFGDGVDAGSVFKRQPPGSVGAGDGGGFGAVLQEVPGVDVATILELSPVNTPLVKPGDVGLEVDGEPVENPSGQPGSGQYVSTSQKKPDQYGIVSYDVTSKWSDAYPGTLHYRLFQNYTILQSLDVESRYVVDLDAANVTWKFNVDVQFPGDAVPNSTALLQWKPSAWTVTSVANATILPPVPHPWWRLEAGVGENEGREFLRVANASSGTWHVEYTSALLDLLVAGESPLVGDALVENVTDSLVLEAKVPAGTNGRPAILDSSKDGGVSDLTVVRGSSWGSTGAIGQSDDLYLGFFTSALDGLPRHQNAQVVLNFSYEDEALERVFADLVNGLEFRLEHAASNLTSSPERVDDLNSSFPLWMVDPDGLDFSKTHQWDGKSYLVNVSFDAFSKQASPVFFNFTANWSSSLDPGDVDHFDLWIVTNFTSYEQTLYLYNWTAGDWVNVTSENLVGGGGDGQDGPSGGGLFFWSSAGTGVDPADFMADVLVGGRLHHNQLRVRLNSSSVSLISGVNTMAIDYLACNVTFVDPVAPSNYTIEFYNFTAGSFGDPVPLEASGNEVEEAFSFDESQALDLFDFELNLFSIRVNLSAFSPSRRTFRFDVARCSLNYTQVQAYAWNQTMLSLGEDVVASTRLDTLKESLNNNATFAWALQEVTQTPGNYTFFTAWTNGTEVAVNTTKLVILGINTSLHVESGASWDGTKWVADPAPHVNDTTKSLKLRLRDDLFGQNLTGATIRAVGWPAGELSFTEIFRYTGDPLDRGLYEVKIDTTGMDAAPSGVPLNLTAELEFYLPTWFVVEVPVLPLPTRVDLGAYEVEVYENASFNLDATFYDEFHEKFVEGARVSWSIGGVLGGDLEPVLFQYSTSVDLEDLGLAPGQYSVVVTASKDGYEAANATVDFEVLPKLERFLSLDLSSFPEELVEGASLRARAKLVDGAGAPVGNETVSFRFQVGTSSGPQEVVRRAVTSSDAGVAEVVFEVPEGASTLSVSAWYDGSESTKAAFASAPGTFKVTSRAEITRRVVTRVAASVAAAAAASSAVLLARRRALRMKIARWAESASRLDDALKVRMLLVIDKTSGNAIVSKNFGVKKVDGDLVGGFLQALTSFGSELAIEKRKAALAAGEGDRWGGMLFDYHDFKILLAEGRHVRGGLILDGPPTERLRGELNRFLSFFEERYARYLENFTGELKPFADVDEHLEKYFHVSFQLPHAVDPAGEPPRPSSAQRRVLETARALHGERGTFTIDALASLAVAGLSNAGKLETLAATYELLEMGALVASKP